ncbi:MAG: hypothetical protein WCO00_18525 [Rhodospirillaceae bacterium]
MSRRRGMAALLLAGLLLSGLLGAGWAGPAAAAEPPGPPVDEGLPIRVKPTLRVDQIPEISEKDSLFKAALTLTYVWRDRRLAFDRRVTGRDVYEYFNDAARARMASIWTPKITILNSTETPRVIGMILIIRDDGTVQITEKLAASLETNYSFADFPFDRQRLLLRLASSEFSREVVLIRGTEVVPNPKLQVKNWQIIRTTTDIGESSSITGRQLSTCFLAVEIKRSSSVAVTQIFMPYIAIIFLPLVCLFNVGPTSPTQLFTSLLALLTLNFKVVLEQPTIVSVSNSVVDAMWMGYCFIGINLMLVFTVMRIRPADAPPMGDLYQELRGVLKWMIPVGFLVLVLGRVLMAQN